MASESETVEDITSEICKVAHNAATANKETKEHWRPAAFLALIADRIEAAHRRDVEKLGREVAELRECVRQASTDVCLKCVRNSRNIVCRKGRECEHVRRWRIALEGAKDEGK